jgi:hypothetical protein
MADPMSPSLSESAGAMKAAMAAFQIKARSQEKEFTPHSQLSARELAMKNLSRKGVVTPTEARSVTGGSQHGAALRNLQAAGIQDEALKVVPNWKMTDAQKRAAAAKAEIRGSENQAVAAMAKFGGELKKQAPTAPPKSFVPVVKTAGGGSGWSTPRAFAPSVATPRTMALSAAPPASRPHVRDKREPALTLISVRVCAALPGARGEQLHAVDQQHEAERPHMWHHDHREYGPRLVSSVVMHIGDAFM